MRKKTLINWVAATTIATGSIHGVAITSVNAQTSTPVTKAATTAPDPKDGSFYLQCDGNPNNMAAGESIARFMGAVTLLGLFAPRPEAPDSSKRKFGADGVHACDSILTGDKAEHNVLRRLPLILARALHHIEAKDYDGAVADVNVARQEANAAELIGNIYFDRSLGLSFDLIESQSLLRMGKIKEARAINIRSAKRFPYSYYPLLLARQMNMFSSDSITPEEESLRNLSKLSPVKVFTLAALFDEARRFADSAAILKALDDYQATAYHDDESDPVSLLLGSGMANSYALAEDWTRAEAINARNQNILSKMRSEGKEIKDEAIIIERMDFYSIIQSLHNGQAVQARRQFAARSRWIAPTFGQITEMNRRLRVGAAKDDLFGSLKDDVEALIARRKQEATARMLELDKDNKSLFFYILPYASVTGYERLSSRVWNTKNNSLIAKEKRPNSEVYLLSVFDADALVQPDALLLHAALQAKARGKNGLVFRIIPESPRIAFVYFANPNDVGISVEQYLDADAVINDLSSIIPSPAALKEREAKRAKIAQ